MNNIRYFKNSDARHLARMVGKEWDLAKHATGSGRLCDWIYCAEILGENTQMLVLTNENGLPIGFAGYSKANNNQHICRRAFWRLVHFILWRCVKNRTALRIYYDVYNYTPADIADMFDAECDILIIDKDWRGGGAGRILFSAMMQDAAVHDVQKMRIDTDDSCNVNFYRAIGARQVYCGIAKNGGEEHTENVYVFCAEPHRFIGL